MGERETLSRERKGEEMNKWLGFSLTPHLRISDRVQEEDEENYVATNQQKALMPHSDCSPFFTDPLTHHPHPGTCIYIRLSFMHFVTHMHLINNERVGSSCL